MRVLLNYIATSSQSYKKNIWVYNYVFALSLNSLISKIDYKINYRWCIYIVWGFIINKLRDQYKKKNMLFFNSLYCLRNYTFTSLANQNSQIKWTILIYIISKTSDILIK
jgi:hypothetical protein